MIELTQDELSPEQKESEPQAELIDQHFKCATCGQDFMWNVSEQNFFHDKGLLHKPTHCHSCRRERHERFEQNRTRKEVT